MHVISKLPWRHLKDLLERAGPDEEDQIKQLLQKIDLEIESYGDAKIVACDMEYRLDRAVENHKLSIDMNLGGVYANTKESQAILDKLKKIATLVKSNLKHHAVRVDHINIYFGETKVDEIDLR